MATLFHQNARCPHIGPKEGGENWMLTGGLLPFPRTGCVLYARAILPYRTSRDEKGEEMEPERNRTSRLSTDGIGLLVRPEPQKRGMTQMAIGGPFHEAHLRNKLRSEPLHFVHLLGSDSCTPV